MKVLRYLLFFLSLHAGLCMDRQGPPTHTRVTRSQSRSAGGNADQPPQSSESAAVCTSVPSSSTSSSGAFAAHPLSTSAVPPSLSANVVSSTVSGSDQPLSPQYTAPLLRDSGVCHSVAFTDGVGSTSFFQSSIADDFVAMRQSSAAPVVSSAFPSFSTPSAPSSSSGSATDAIRDLATRFAEFTSYFTAQLSRLQAATILPTAPSAAVQSTLTPSSLHVSFRPVAPGRDTLLQSVGAAMPRLLNSQPGDQQLQSQDLDNNHTTGLAATHARVSSPVTRNQSSFTVPMTALPSVLHPRLPHVQPPLNDSLSLALPPRLPPHSRDSPEPAVPERRVRLRMERGYPRVPSIPFDVSTWAADMSLFFTTRMIQSPRRRSAHIYAAFAAFPDVLQTIATQRLDDRPADLLAYIHASYSRHRDVGHERSSFLRLGLTQNSDESIPNFVARFVRRASVLGFADDDIAVIRLFEDGLEAKHRTLLWSHLATLQSLQRGRSVRTSLEFVTREAVLATEQLWSLDNARVDAPRAPRSTSSGQSSSASSASASSSSASSSSSGSSAARAAQGARANLCGVPGHSGHPKEACRALRRLASLPAQSSAATSSSAAALSAPAVAYAPKPSPTSAPSASTASSKPRHRFLCTVPGCEHPTTHSNERCWLLIGKPTPATSSIPGKPASGRVTLVTAAPASPASSSSGGGLRVFCNIHRRSSSSPRHWCRILLDGF